MNVAVVGIGIAGSYLLSRLSEHHQVTGYEFLPYEKFDAVCSWGASKHEMKRMIQLAGLNFDDYILHEGNEMHVQLGKIRHVVKLKGLCTFDKRRLILDLVRNQDVKFQTSPSLEELQRKGFDMIIDATGMHRHLLPRLEDDLLIPSVQYRLKYEDMPFDDFYIRPFSKLGGYLWFFPLGNDEAHVGAADYFHRHDEELAKFLQEHPGEIIKKAGRPIRVSPPSVCGPPFMVKGKTRLVGVGESVGTVFPMLGEGIIPSLQSAMLLIENLQELKIYQSRLLEKFEPYVRMYELLRARFEGKVGALSQMLFLWSIYAAIKKDEERYGMRISITDILKTSLLKRLSFLGKSLYL